MVEQTMTDIYICVDCVFYHTYGDLPDDENRAYEVGSCQADVTVDCGDNDEYCQTFSWQPCATCHTRLGGERHRAWLL
jgi:hypothetical protein